MRQTDDARHMDLFPVQDLITFAHAVVFAKRIAAGCRHCQQRSLPARRRLGCLQESAQAVVEHRDLTRVCMHVAKEFIGVERPVELLDGRDDQLRRKRVVLVGKLIAKSTGASHVPAMPREWTHNRYGSDCAFQILGSGGKQVGHLRLNQLGRRPFDRRVSQHHSIRKGRC